MTRVRRLAVTYAHRIHEIGDLDALLPVRTTATAMGGLAPGDHSNFSIARSMRSREESHGRALAPIRSQRTPKSRTSVLPCISLPPPGASTNTSSAFSVVRLLNEP